MITKANHFAIFVLDQNSAYDFYVNKLGFKVNTDAVMGPKGRWLTVNPPNQPDLEITLMAIDDKMMFNGESAEIMSKFQRSNPGLSSGLATEIYPRHPQGPKDKTSRTSALSKARYRQLI